MVSSGVIVSSDFRMFHSFAVFLSQPELEPAQLPFDACFIKMLLYIDIKEALPQSKTELHPSE